VAVFRYVLKGEAFAALAVVGAGRVAPRIGGRYVPKGDARAARDAAVWKAWNGRNREDVMRQFRISRALLYSILARRPRATT
jgi:Mor family transcriptional regulator